MTPPFPPFFLNTIHPDESSKDETEKSMDTKSLKDRVHPIQYRIAHTTRYVLSGISRPIWVPRRNRTKGVKGMVFNLRRKMAVFIVKPVSIIPQHWFDLPACRFGDCRENCEECQKWYRQTEHFMNRVPEKVYYLVDHLHEDLSNPMWSCMKYANESAYLLRRIETILTSEFLSK